MSSLDKNKPNEEVKEKPKENKKQNSPEKEEKVQTGKFNETSNNKLNLTKKEYYNQNGFYNYPYKVSSRKRFCPNPLCTVTHCYRMPLNKFKINTNSPKQKYYLPPIIKSSNNENLENFYLTSTAKHLEDKLKKTNKNILSNYKNSNIYQRNNKSLDNNMAGNSFNAKIKYDKNIYNMNKINKIDYSYLEKVRLHRKILKDQMINRHKFQHSRRYLTNDTKNDINNNKDNNWDNIDNFWLNTNSSEYVTPAKEIFYEKADNKMSGFEKIYVNFSSDKLEKNVAMKKMENKKKLNTIELLFPQESQKNGS